MKYIQLASNPDDHQHYTVCVPAVVRPAVTSCSIIDLGTPADKKLKGVILSDEEYASLPESELDKIEGADFNAVDLFDPRDFLENTSEEDLYNALVHDAGNNVVWSHTEDDNGTLTEVEGLISHGDLTDDASFSLNLTYTAAIGKIPLRWSFEAEGGATLTMNESGDVTVGGTYEAPVHAHITVTIDMSDFDPDYPLKNCVASKTFETVIGDIK